MAKQRNVPKRAMQTVAPGDAIVITPGISVAYSFTGVTLDTNWRELMFSVKTNVLTTDDAPDILVLISNPAQESDGLRFVDRQEVELTSPARGGASLSVTPDGLDVFVSAAITTLFRVARPNARYVIRQRIDGDVLDVRIVTTGKAAIRV